MVQVVTRPGETCVSLSSGLAVACSYLLAAPMSERPPGVVWFAPYMGAPGAAWVYPRGVVICVGALCQQRSVMHSSDGFDRLHGDGCRVESDAMPLEVVVIPGDRLSKQSCPNSRISSGGA